MERELADFMQKPNLIERYKRYISSPAGSLAKLQAKVAHLQALDALVQALLPPSLSGHCQVADAKPPKLTLQADSPAAGMQLRMLAPDILQQLHTEHALFEIREVNCQIAPQGFKVSAPEKRKVSRTISEHSRSVISTLGEEVSHPALKQALDRLAKQKKSPNDSS